MIKTCIRSFRLNGLMFAAGNEYKVELNPVDGNLYIYTVWGYTTITTNWLNYYFI